MDPLTSPGGAEANPQVVYSWKAPLRAYKKRSGGILRFYIAVSLLLSVLVFFFGDKILIIPIVTVFFLFYVLTVTPPPEITNKITTFGIDAAGTAIRWEVLSHFYFTKRFGYEVLTLVTHPPYLIHVYMVVPDEETRKKLMPILTHRLIYQEKPHMTITDRMIEWLSNLTPDEEETEAAKPLLQKKTPAAL